MSRQRARPGGNTGHLRLSKTDLCILRELAGGYSNKELGDRLSLSPHTVANRITHLNAHFGSATRLGLLVAAIKAGYVNVD